MKEGYMFPEGRGVRYTMKKNLSLLIIILGLVMFISACNSDGNSNVENNSAANEAVNETEEVNEEEEATPEENDYRIISTTVALTEIMNELEIDLVGVPTSYKDLPERYKDATEVGMAMDP